MTNQRDPRRRRPEDYVRGRDGSMRALAIGAGVVMLLLLAYLMFAPSDSPNPTTAERGGSPTTGNVPNPQQPTPQPTKPQ